MPRPTSDLPWEIAKKFATGKKTVCCCIAFNQQSSSVLIERDGAVRDIVRENGGRMCEGASSENAFAELSEKSTVKLLAHPFVSHIRPATRWEAWGRNVIRAEETIDGLVVKCRNLLRHNR